MNKSALLSFVIVALFIGVGFLIYDSRNPPTGLPLVSSFEECVAAGYPVMESYPRQCRAHGGTTTFVETIPNPEPEPAPTPSPVTSGFVSGHVNIGPNCPVEREGEPCPTPPEAYTSRTVVVYQSDGITIKQRGKINTLGNYKITLAPGNYFLQIDPAGIGPGEKKPVTVKANQTMTVNFDIDTGIR